MKSIFSLSAIALFALLVTFQTGVTSCTKETITRDTVTIITRDTNVIVTIDTVRLVKNQVPVVNAGSDSTFNLTTFSDSLQLSGSAADADNSIAGYLWSQVSGPGTALIINPGSATTYITQLVSGTYMFQLMAIDSDGAVGIKTVSVTIVAPQSFFLALQPGSTDGQDALVGIRATDGSVVANTNFNSIPELSISRWTYNAQGAGGGTNRAYLKFAGLSAIPAGAEIVSAKLSLFGLNQQETSQSSSTPQGNSFYPGSTYPGNNKSWIKRVTGGDWEETTITWNNKPATTTTNQAELPASTSQYNFDVVDLDITNMVKDILSSGRNYGFCLQLQNEQIYRSLLFASSEFTDAAKRPKLVVEYRN